MKQRRSDGTFGIEGNDSSTVERKKTGKPRGRPFQPGRKKTGGRVAGTPNKFSTSALEIMQARGVSPIDYLCDQILNDREHPDRRQRAALKLVDLVYPTKREMSGNLNLGGEVAVALQAGRERAAKLRKCQLCDRSFVGEKCPHCDTRPSLPAPALPAATEPSREPKPVSATEDEDLEKLSDEELDRIIAEGGDD